MMRNDNFIDKNCIYHPEKIGVAYCKRCDGYICKECIIKVNDKNRCKKCYEDYNIFKSNNMGNKSFYCTSCGSKILQSHLYCYNCGKKVEIVNEVMPQEKKKITNESNINDQQKYDEKTTKKIDVKDYCFHCVHYDNKFGACSLIQENVLNYPSKFIKQCNGKFFSLNPKFEGQVKEIKSNTADQVFNFEKPKISDEQIINRHFHKSSKPDTSSKARNEKQLVTDVKKPLSQQHFRFQSQSFFHPVDNNKSCFPNLIFFEIEGDKISVERKEDGTINIAKEGMVIFKIPKDNTKKISNIEILGHKISVQYKELPSILGMLVWNSGFRIHVDGKPLEKTSGDPRVALKYASYAFFFFAGMSPFTIFFSENPSQKFVALALFPILVIFGFLTKKIPIFANALGSIFGAYEVFFYVIQSFETGYVQQTGWFLFWLLLRSGATLALIQGFFAGVKIRVLKRGTALK